MKYGFYIPSRGPSATPDNLITIVRKAEDLGFDSIFVGDHLIIPRSIGSPYPYTPNRLYPGADGEAPEHITLLAFLAGQTTSLRLVTSVTILPYRNPILTAKAMVTVDVLSKGRLVAGIGAGWMREEFEQLGVQAFEERGPVTDEYLRAFVELWTSDSPTFQGKYCSFSDIYFLPRPVQKPHPPIWVGGESPAALRRAGQIGNGWYPLGSNPDFPLREPKQLHEGIQSVARHAERFGREPSRIEITYLPSLLQGYRLMPAGDAEPGPSGGRLSFRGTADQIASDVRQHEEMGVTTVVANFFQSTGNDLEEGLRLMEEMATEVWPRV